MGHGISEFSETLSQACFYPNFWCCTMVHSSAGDSNISKKLSAEASQTEDSRSPNLAFPTKDQKIATNPMPQGLS